MSIFPNESHLVGIKSICIIDSNTPTDEQVITSKEISSKNKFLFIFLELQNSLTL